MRLWLGLLLSLLFVLLFLWHINPGDVLRHLRETNPYWLALAVMALALDFAFRIKRWTQLLRHFNPTLRSRDTAGPFLASFAINNVVPLRAGDVARAFAFTRELGTSSGYVTSTLVVERVLDLAALLALLMISLPWLDVASDLAWINASTYLLLGLALGAVLLVLAIPGWWARLVGKLPGQDTAILKFVHQVLDGLTEFNNPLTWIQLCAWSMLIWFLEGCAFLLACLALGAAPGGSSAWFTVSVASLGTLLPSSPGYIGTFDYIAALALHSTGMARDLAASSAILIHLVLWTPVTLTGGLYILQHWGREAGSRIRTLKDRQV